jgi:methionine synthase II (cobalamin-independent)
MLKERRQAAETVAEKLFVAEAAIDAALAAVAALTASMPEATKTAKIHTHICQDALAKAMESCAKLVQARASIIGTHDALYVAQKTIGLGKVTFNPMNIGVMKSPSAEADEYTRHLAVVAA